MSFPLPSKRSKKKSFSFGKVCSWWKWRMGTQLCWEWGRAVRVMRVLRHSYLSSLAPRTQREREKEDWHSPFEVSVMCGFWLCVNSCEKTMSSSISISISNSNSTACSRFFWDIFKDRVFFHLSLHQFHSNHSLTHSSTSLHCLPTPTQIHPHHSHPQTLIHIIQNDQLEHC